MISGNQFHILVSKQAPTDADGDWRRADVVCCGQIVATGYALKRKGDQERAVEGEAITLAKHNFERQIEVRHA